MDVAALNVRITIQKNETVRDKIGNHTSKWTNYFTCWATASASGQLSQETQDAGQTLEEDRLDFTVRYSSETAAVISTKFRIILNDRFYDIDHVDDMNFKKHSLKFRTHLVRR